jgi:hypothetical protein
MLSVIFAAIGIIGGKVVGVDFWVQMKVLLEWHAKSFSLCMIFLMAPSLKVLYLLDLYMDCGVSRLCL